MKTLKIILKNQGGAVTDEFWNQLIKIDNGTIEETENSFTIILTDGKKLLVDKTKVYENDNSRTVWWGSLKEIGDSDFLFSKMKGTGMFEILHGYFAFQIGSLGGYHILCKAN